MGVGQFFFFLLVSGLLVAFGQPLWISGIGIVSGAIGYAFFWKAMFYFSERKQRFWLAVFWFASVQAVQLSWMTSTYYLGPLILPVYFLLVLGLGLQFAFLSFFISSAEPLLFRKSLAMCGGWVLLEWMRVFLLTGFTWNPVGLALSSSLYSVQFAALFGVYGLSFWVILVNLVALNAFFLKKTAKSQLLWLSLALLPYGFGWIHQNWVETNYKKSAANFSVALVETGLTVEEKYGVTPSAEDAIPPLEQWIRVWNYLKPDTTLNLIVLPEGAFPGTAYRPYYFLEEVKEEWALCFGENALASLPPLAPPLAFPYRSQNKIHWKVNNAFLSQALSNYFESDLIVGLNDEQSLFRYNAAFYFRPDQSAPERHEKRILAPVGEYIPLGGISWISDFIQMNFGICDSFHVGEKATVFSGKVPIGVAICLEEIYGSVVRELRQNGAKLLVSLSNDCWFPSSRLARQHFEHGRIRSVENGVYLLRSSNMGITGGADCLGRPLPSFPYSDPNRDMGGGALYLSLPIYSYPTFYSWWGDRMILFLSSLFLIFGSLCRYRIENLAPK